MAAFINELIALDVTAWLQLVGGVLAVAFVWGFCSGLNSNTLIDFGIWVAICAGLGGLHSCASDWDADETVAALIIFGIVWLALVVFVVAVMIGAAKKGTGDGVQ